MASYDQPPPYASQPPPPGWKPETVGGYGAAPTTSSGYAAGYAAPGGVSYAPGTQPVITVAPEENMFGAGTTYRFDDKSIRRGFIRKVFLILTGQLLVTFGVCALFYFVDGIHFFLVQNFWLYYVSYGVFLVTYISLVCCRSCARKAPCNFITLAVLTLAMTYMVATITSFYSIESVMIAFGITMALCIALTIFAWQTKIDFTMCTGLLFCLVMVLFLTGISIWIWGAITGSYNRWMFVVYGGLGALVFSFFLVYDVQSVVGGRKYDLSPEEYIFGAVQIYLDVVYIFLMLLSVVGGSRGNN